MCARTLVALLGLAACPAWAAGDPDAARGLLADRCADCHAIPGYGGHSPPEGLTAPDLAAIANDQAAYTEERLRTSLPHRHDHLVARLGQSNTPFATKRNER